MSQRAEILSAIERREGAAFSTIPVPKHRRQAVEVALVFSLILAAVWTPLGLSNTVVSLLAAACVLAVAFTGRWTAAEMGFSRPLSGAIYILLAGVLLCGIIAAIGSLFRAAGPGYFVPWNRSWQYALWAFVQQFILQSVFFLRLESILGPRRAVIAAASLFALDHLPSPLLTLLALFGGILFCECFRRWRNLYPLGAIHAGLGLTIAAQLPDKWLHHMRVGIGYLTMHS